MVSEFKEKGQNMQKKKKKRLGTESLLLHICKCKWYMLKYKNMILLINSQICIKYLFMLSFLLATWKIQVNYNEIFLKALVLGKWIIV